MPQIVLDENSPPTEMEESSWNHNGDEASMFDQELLVPRSITLKIRHFFYVAFLQGLAWETKWNRLAYVCLES